MTVNTQELRELLAGLPTEPGCKHLAVPYSPKRIGFGHSGGPAWFLASSGSCTGPGEVLQYLRSMGELLNALPALLDEIDALRAELQARQWQPIETCPRKHGKHYLICKDCGPGSLPSISIGFCFDDQKDWHLMDSNCTAEMYGYRVTHWHPLPLPPAPPQGDGA